jgi:hypothetical protein
MQKRGWRMAFTLWAAVQSVAETPIWPPAWPDGSRGTVQLMTSDFLVVPPEVSALSQEPGAAPFTVARHPPRLELVYHDHLPHPALNGTGWSSWGDICVASDGRVYCGIGDHGNNQTGAHCFIYRWDPRLSRLTQVVDVNAVTPPKPGTPWWSKIHARILEDADGGILFVGTLNDGGRAYTFQWTRETPGAPIFRLDPKTDEVTVIGHLPGACTATTLGDPRRRMLYLMLEGRQAGATAFAAFDLAALQFVFISPDDAVTQNRNMAIARNGVLYFNGQGPALWTYDPKQRAIRPTTMTLPGGAFMRASTDETPDGWIYGVTFWGKEGHHHLFRFAPAEERVEMLGPTFLSGEYTTVAVLSPDARFVYYLPGAHGSAWKIGTPVVQYDTKKGIRKVLAFLRDPCKARFGYVPAGTYGVKISSDGATLYINFNGHADDPFRLSGMKATGFGLTAFAALHIPSEER